MLAICGCAILAGAGRLLAEEPPGKGPKKAPAPVSAQAVAQAPRAAAPGSLLVHVDTKTLQLSLEPGAGTVPLELSADILNVLNTSFDGLTPIRKGENTTWDLEGRYGGVWLAVTGADGKAHVFCVTSLPTRVAEAAQAVRQQARGVK
ncbi:MAG: hypothetical protein ACYDBY_01110 [Thermoanaerobaculia bacterium]